jgi:hypothetical protein
MELRKTFDCQEMPEDVKEAFFEFKSVATQ